MKLNPEVYFTLTSIVSFTTGEFIFQGIMKSTSALWMNAFKATVATVSFFIAVILGGFLRFKGQSPQIDGLQGALSFFGLNLSTKTYAFLLVYGLRWHRHRDHAFGF